MVDGAPWNPSSGRLWMGVPLRPVRPSGILGYPLHVVPTIDNVSEPIHRALSAWPQVTLALVFGSVARGVAREDSDVDIAFESDGDVDVLGLAHVLGVAVGHEVHLLRLRDATIPVLDEIVHDGIVVHEGRASAAAEWRTRALCSLEIDRPWYARMRDAWLKEVAEGGLSRG
jgi:uncharacterized protein